VEGDGKVDGEKQWRADYSGMPEFGNWIEYFSDNMVVKNENRYEMREEMVPETLIDIDDMKI
jgi:hypothetical protein